MFVILQEQTSQSNQPPQPRVPPLPTDLCRISQPVSQHYPSGSCPPHTLPRGRTPSWAQVQIQPWPCHYRDERRPLFFSLKPLMNPNKSVFPDYLFLLLLYMTYFYSLLFHQPSLNLTYVPRRSTARGNVSNPG